MSRDELLNGWYGLIAIGDGWKPVTPSDQSHTPILPDAIKAGATHGRYLAFLIDGAPQIVHLAADLDVHLLKVPVPVAKSVHSRDPLPADVRSEHRPEPVPPLRTLS
jgi:hypothetical protein